MGKHHFWLGPLLFLGLFAPFTPYLDLATSQLFYTPDSGFYNNGFFQFLFRYGELFGLATGAGALTLFLLSFCHARFQKWRRPTFAIVCTLVIGAGLLTNALLKGYWGRPRPKQIENFGGKHDYRPFWQPNFHSARDPQKSFPSGHVAMGFYFLSVALVGRRLKMRSLFWTGLFLSLFLGGGLMITRVVQGGHFLSDVVVSPILMWLVALGLDLFTWGEGGRRLLFPKRSDTSPKLD